MGLAGGVFLALMLLSGAMLVATMTVWPHPAIFPGTINWVVLGSGALFGALMGPSALHGMGVLPQEWECLNCAHRWVGD